MPTRRIRTNAGELRGQLIIFAVVLWTLGAVNIAGSHTRLIGGRGSDFLHFYALATVGASSPSEFADSLRVRDAQLRAVPESVDHHYPSVYGPQVAIALSPLARFNYVTALTVWSLVTVGLYSAAMFVAIRGSKICRRYPSVAVLGAVGFPPFWYLVQYGQLSAVALVLVVLASEFVIRGRPVAAGAMLGLLIYKPSIFVPIIAILGLGGAWQMAAAMVVSGVIEVASTLWWVGPQGLQEYVELMLKLPSMAHLMAARPDQMHSLRSLWSLLLGESSLSTGLYAISAVAALIAAAHIWRKVERPAVRMAALLLGTVLASPHFYVYELVLLAPAWVWLADWYLSESLPLSVGRTLYVGYLSALFGYVATAVPIQLSVLCAAFLLWALVRWTTTTLDSRALQPSISSVPTGVSIS